MCDPFTLAAAAASGIGALINKKQENANTAAQNASALRSAQESRKARTAETQRQRTMEASSADAIREAATRAAPSDVAKRVREETAGGAGEIQAAGAKLPRIVAGENANLTDLNVASDMDTTAKETARRLAGLATLTAQTTEQGGVGDLIQTLGGDVADINATRRGSARVAAHEADVPAIRINPGYNPLGDLLLAGGSAAGMFGGDASTSLGDMIYKRPMTSPLPTRRPMVNPLPNRRPM